MQSIIIIIMLCYLCTYRYVILDIMEVLNNRTITFKHITKKIYIIFSMLFMMFFSNKLYFRNINK